jgi:ribonuclease P protein component
VLRQSRRISGRQRIQLVLKDGERLKGRSLSMLRLENPANEKHCYAVVVSKKVHKLAVQRNRLRRQIFESIRTLQKEGVVPSGAPSDIVVLARKSLLNKDFTEIKTSMRQLFTTNND